MSPSAAETLLTGADPNKPPKNRVTKTAAAFLLVAVPMEKRPRQNIAGNMLTFLPHNSDTGAQQRGPRANPRLEFSRQNAGTQAGRALGVLTCTEISIGRRLLS